jgi:hypothetical protein
MNAFDQFFLQQPEPNKSCLLALKAIVLHQHPEMTTAWKYGMPFFCFKSRMFCYLWVHKKTGQPYLGFVEGKHLHHPLLIQEKRARMKIMLFDAETDLPIETITHLLQEMITLYINR